MSSLKKWFRFIILLPYMVITSIYMLIHIVKYAFNVDLNNRKLDDSEFQSHFMGKFSNSEFQSHFMGKFTNSIFARKYVGLPVIVIFWGTIIYLCFF